MAFDEGVAERIREVMCIYEGITEKYMFGGIAFMLCGNMCVGVIKDQLMLRVGPEQYETLLKQQYVKKMDFTGKPLPGFLYIQPEGFSEDADLVQWIEKAYQYVSSLPVK